MGGLEQVKWGVAEGLEKWWACLVSQNEDLAGVQQTGLPKMEQQHPPQLLWMFLKRNEYTWPPQV